MTEIAGCISEIIDELRTSPYLVLLGYCEGIRVSAVLRDSSLVLSYAVEPSRRPSRAEIVSVFDNMEKYHEALCKEYPEYHAFADGRTIVSEAVVFSGQMDFTVAQKTGNSVEWLVELE